MTDLRKLRNKNLFKYFTVRNVFTPEECNLIINSPDTFEQKDALIGADIGRVDTSVRKTKVKFFKQTPDTLWIGDRIHKYAWEANRNYFNFNISFLADLELLEYREGYFYDWHVDITPSDGIDSRKLSIIIFLSDPEDYDGGGVGFDFGRPSVVLSQGSMLIFSSLLRHKVHPVTRGIRHSFVAWAYGDPFY